MFSRTRVHTAALLLAAIAPARAQLQDAPPVNTSEILSALRQLRDTQTAQVKTTRQAALQKVTASAGSGERAAGVWEEAIRAIQFEGAARENAVFRDWWEKEGIGLKGKEAQSAARLYFIWLGLTLQRAGGMSVKDLLPQVIGYTKELFTDMQIAQVLSDSVQRDKDQAAGGKRNILHDKQRANEVAVKRMHDLILNRGLGGSAPVQWMKIADLVAPENWETTPGNLEAIYNKVVLPEMRDQKDPRVLEYWDLKIKRESDVASAKRVDFEITKFNTVRRPELLWSRAEDMALIGQKNKAAGEMLALIKAHPTHPSAAAWIGKLEELLVPPPPPAPAPAAAP